MKNAHTPLSAKENDERWNYKIILITFIFIDINFYDNM
jgi:hypothetical protein